MLNYLGEHYDESLSSLEIVKKLSASGVSKSAVYRNLTALEQDGKVRRIAKVGERTAYYQFVGSNCVGKIHLSCIKCGKTGHISSETAKYLTKSLNDQDGFALDSGETVLYGVCKECKS